ncbi:hypothetical protein UFOVP1433_43 [uncultured Caudovirales phage]|uniref:Uncharacterized protein n=1 Tax=uncultured Caudovirales phage TaxID=2100421 RepID=A0A6J5MY07_9CAUD|nr:hypothetical protein UFOVP553_43 [uncultured Caudovirales phage]CAB4183207.1 hypothetical protein UFOVP1081_43 [uncultured Caudovirales phage]CAB4213025.1 hypothetical protein UFOVP1433_43 [uncultured Caudovirales phage]
MTPRRVDIPTPGWYRVRLAKGGPWIPCRIAETDGLWICFVDGTPTAKAALPDPWSVPKMEWVNFSRAMTEAEYLALVAERSATGAASPLADATAPIDWRNGRMSNWNRNTQ